MERGELRVHRIFQCRAYFVIVFVNKDNEFHECLHWKLIELIFSGAAWDRTKDIYFIRVALYRWATAPATSRL